MNAIAQAVLATTDTQQTNGVTWPSSAMYACKYKMHTWPCGWQKEWSVNFMDTKEELDAWLAHKADWALCEDNYTKIEVFEWDFGPQQIPALCVGL